MTKRKLQLLAQRLLASPVAWFVLGVSLGLGLIALDSPAAGQPPGSSQCVTDSECYELYGE